MSVIKIFVALVICTLIGTVLQILHVSSFLAATFLAISLALAIVLIVMAVKKLAKT